MSKLSAPANTPTLTCVTCGVFVKPHVTLAADDGGQVFEVAYNSWPIYHIDIKQHRWEFCGPSCVNTWMRKTQTQV